MALRLYRKCHFIVDKKTKETKKHKLDWGDIIFICIMLPTAALFIYGGFGILFSQAVLIDLFKNSYGQIVISLCLGGLLFSSIIDIIVKNNLANKFENLPKINETGCKS
jgi:uncharacterized membrane protein